jgi:hypothetical protein
MYFWIESFAYPGGYIYEYLADTTQNILWYLICTPIYMYTVGSIGSVA